MINEPEFKSKRRPAGELVRILLVEDDPVFAELVQTQLRQMRWVESRLESAGTLAEALERLSAERFDLVITDLKLPDSSGLATIGALTRAADQPVIVLTGDATPEVRAGAIEAGAYDFLHKDQLSAAALERLVRLGARQAGAFRALRDSEARFRGLIGLSSDWYWEQDEALRFTRFEGRRSETARSALGKRRWEIAGLTPISCSWEEHRAALEARRPFRDFRYSRAGDDGTTSFISASGEPVYDAGGHFCGYRGVASDITERKRAEQLLTLEHDVAQCLAGADTVSAGLEAVIRYFCQTESWAGGRYWRADAEAGVLRFGAAWAPAGSAMEKYNEDSRDKVFRAGTGYVGRVWQSGEPLWIADVQKDGRALRTDVAPELQNRSSFVFPVALEGKIIGVFAFNSFEVREPDERLLQAVRAIGSQIGQFVQRKQAEVGVRQSEERFRSLTKLSSDWYWEQDENFRFTGMADATGGSRERGPLSAIGQTRWDTPALNMTEADWAAHRAVLEAHQPFRDLELQRLTPDGRLKYTSISGEPIFDGAGAFKGYRGVGKDITARKRAEQLKNLEHAVTLCLAQAESVSAALKAVIREICNSEGWECGRYFYADKNAGVLRFGEAWGVADAAIERYIEASRRATYPLDAGPEAARDGGLARSTLGISRAAFAFAVVSAGESIGVMSFTSRTVREPDAPLLQTVRVIGSQIGQFLQRKEAEQVMHESEERFRSLAALSSDMYWEQDTEYRFTSFSGTAINRILTDRMVGKRRWDSKYFNMGEADWAAHRAVLEARQPFRDLELGRVNEAGEKIWLSVSGEPFFDDAGRFAGYRGVGRDITARKREAELLRLEQLVARCLSEADSASAALCAVIRAICETQNWECGRYFGWDERAGALSMQEFWHVPSAALEVLIAKSRAVGYQPGVGLIGEAYGSAQPVWVTDLASDPRAKSGLARDAGMHGAFLFRVISDGKPIGVFVFHSRQVREPDERLLNAVRVIGSQVGQFVQRWHAESRRREMEVHFRRTFELAGTGLAHIGLDRRFIRVNRRLCEIFGYPEAELLGHTAKEFSHPDDLDIINRERPRLYSGEIDAVRGEKRYLRKDGSVVWLAYAMAVERDAQGKPLYEIAAFDDVTERKRAEQRQAAHLRYQERIARFGQAALVEREPAELIDKAVQAVLEALAADAVAYLETEPGAEGLVQRALVGVADPGAPPGSIACPNGSPLARVVRSGSRMVTGGGDALPLAWARELSSAALVPVRGDNKVRGVLCAGFRQPGAFAVEELNFVDAAASILSTALQRIDSEARLAYLAQFDPLTGLPNRALLADRFSQMIVQAKRRDALLAVLFIDLDGFKSVNDTLGHAGGDALLKEVAVRLQSTVRGGDTVARISGDEFAVVLGDLARTEDAALVAQKIINRIGATVDIGGKEVFVTASVGIAAFPVDGADADALIVAADAAMYRAKQAGRNAFQFFTAEINQRTRARAQMGSDLRRALEREEFALVYQPKVELADRRTVGAEALLRWKHPERGMVSPAEFVPVLEETGLIVPVGDWVLRRACADLKAWRDAGLAVVPVAVNLSARQFRQQDLDAHIKSLVAAAGIDAALIELEITESQLMQDPDQAIRVMRSLRDAGIRIAIDDFGTGYSSLSTLRRFPVAALKIDRSFVKDMSSEGGDASIVRTVIEMAYALGFTVVAEGVETEEQAKTLYLLRCQQAQGYLFARPMPAKDFQGLL